MTRWLHAIRLCRIFKAKCHDTLWNESKELIITLKKHLYKMYMIRIFKYSLNLRKNNRSYPDVICKGEEKCRTPSSSNYSKDFS